MKNNTAVPTSHQHKESSDWRLWSSFDLAGLPIAVRDCRLFAAARSGTKAINADYRSACRRDVCPSCGYRSAYAFIETRRLRWAIPTTTVWPMVIAFTPLLIGGKKHDIASSLFFQDQRLRMLQLKEDLRAAWGASREIAGWYGVAHLVSLRGYSVRHHLHVGLIGTFAGAKDIIAWLKTWAAKNGANMKVDPKAGTRSLIGEMGYLRHPPVRTGERSGDFSIQGLASVHDVLEKPWRMKTKGAGSMFIRFVDGPAWSTKGMRRIASRVVCERTQKEGLRTRLRYIGDARFAATCRKSMPSINLVVKCPAKKGKNGTTRCMGISKPLTLGDNPLSCVCDQCGHAWKLQRISGRPRVRKPKAKD